MSDCNAIDENIDYVYYLRLALTTAQILNIIINNKF